MGAPKKKQRRLIQTIVLVAIAGILVISALLTVMSVLTLRSRYYTDTRNSLASSSYMLGRMLSNEYDGAWAAGSDGRVTKGSTDVTTEYLQIMDEAKKETSYDYSVILGRKTVLSTMVKRDDNSIRSTNEIPESVAAMIEKDGYHYEKSRKLEGRTYCSYYRVLKDDDGNNVGFVMAAEDSDLAESEIDRAMAFMIVLAVVFFAVAAVIGTIVSRKVSKSLTDVAEDIQVLASGKLDIKHDQKMLERNDELGTISRSVKLLDEKLGEVVRDTKKMTAELSDSSMNLSTSSDQASQASNQVSSAVNDIAKGATNQADSVQNASNDTSSMDSDIDQISENVTQLKEYASEMRDSCDKTVEAINLLTRQSENVTDSVNEIGNTINSTNESVQDIARFSDAITDIANQTNLLSLNASIEAARAGEAGRGFAVVADEIRDLADQSKNSADEISSIVEKLLADSESSVANMGRLTDSFNIQEEKLSTTKDEMNIMIDKVKSVADSVEVIAGRVEGLSSSKTSLTDIISDLSAISQENAASTEETNASMEELASTFAVINEAAVSLKQLAENLKKTVDYFQI